MHTQTESTQVLRRGRVLPSAAAGPLLYLLTLSVEVLLGASTRWLLVYLGAATLGILVPLGLSAEVLAWVAALTPIAWSLIGLVLPGRGWVWGRQLGARRTTTEEQMALSEALQLLRSVDPDLREPLAYLVLDDPLPSAAVRGRTLILSRGLLDSDSLAPVLAHELGHASSLDGRLTEALNRLVIWDDPLRPPQAESGGEASLEVDPDPRGGLLWCLIRWALRLSGGGFSQRLLDPLWAAHWRAREYAADAHAEVLGQAEDLARHLHDQEQAFDVPQPGLLNSCQHPPVALRIERLSAISAGEGSK